MSKVWRKAILQWQEPDSAGGVWHQPGDVYEIDTDKVFDDEHLIRNETHVEATEDEIKAATAAAAPQSASLRTTKVIQGAAKPIQPDDLLKESESQ